MNDIVRQISQIGIIPVIAIDNAADAVPLAKALSAGGLSAAEVTFRTEAAADAIAAIAEACPDVLLGAGTVLNVDQCKRALAAGAKFIVSPGYNPELVDYCLSVNVPVLPGCVNASDMTRAVNAGLSIVKFFPAEASGGIAFLKSLAPVFPKLSFLPTGGVNTGNLSDYMNFNRIIACGGTWMVKKDLIAGHQWDTITKICREAVDKMLALSLAHVGINCENEEAAQTVAEGFSSLLGTAPLPAALGIFVGNAVECMKAPGRGTCGHIALSTPNVDRAVYHLSRRGLEFDMDSILLDAKGNTRLIYLKNELGGFAVHLVQK